MFQIKNVTIVHRKDLRTLAEDFSFVLNPGDKAVMIGEEGNGKSTLLKWIYDPELVADYAEVTGERVLSGERLGYLPQELPAADREKTVYEFFTEDEVFWEQTPRELGELASRFRVAEDFFYRDQRMETLSGGEKVKAQLMRLLFRSPTVFLLDEPSNDIDLHTLEWLEGFIRDAKETFLFISHDEVLIERTATVVVHMEQLRRKTMSRTTVMRVPYAEYVQMREANMHNQEVLAQTQRREMAIKEEKYRQLRQKVEHAQASVSRQDPATGRLLKKKMHVVKSMEHRYEREKEEMTERPDTEDAMYLTFDASASQVPAGKTVLELELPELRSPSGTVLARDISLRIRGSEKVCIIGDNGAGKSTLIRKIAEELLERPDLKAQYMPQNYIDLLDEEATPVDFLCKVGDKEERTRIRTYLGSMKYTADEMAHRIGDLSGGQKAKVLLLKLKMSGANVLILDEPTRNFSPLSGPVIRRMLRDFPGAILSVSHDRRFMEEVCDRVLVLTPQGLKETR